MSEQEPFSRSAEAETSRTAPPPRAGTRHPADGGAPPGRILVEVDRLDFCYGSRQVLHDVTLGVEERKVTAFIGPSGCGKSTLLRCLNRMSDLVDGARVTRGAVRIHGVDINRADVDVIELRKRVGMVFQKSTPFPRSIYDNIAFGLRIAGVRRRGGLDEIVERSLRGVGLWDEVKDRLDRSGLGLSAGQQQRLCIARTIAVEPDILLMDEPCSALDPAAAAGIEELVHELKRRFTIVIVTHNMQQAARVSDRTAFFHLGRLVEYGSTGTIFMGPSDPQTEAYVSGRFG